MPVGVYTDTVYSLLMSNTLYNVYSMSRSRIHKRTISLAIILRVFRPEVSISNVNITTQFQSTFAQEGGGGRSTPLVGVTGSKEENFKDFCPNYVQEFGIRSQDTGYIYH
jgi:hypothetical protein